MGNSSSLDVANAVYDFMQGEATRHALTYYPQSQVFYTDVQAEGVELPTEYALIRQFNSALVPKTVSGNVRKQQATLIIEFNVSKFNTQEGRNLQTTFAHHMSATSFEHDIVIDSVTTNEYNNQSGAKFVTVIDFNYFLRV